MPEGSEFAARVYAAINARDRGAIKALSAPDIVVEELAGHVVASMRQRGRRKASGAQRGGAPEEPRLSGSARPRRRRP